uniref:Protein KIBRA n=1 Tax=Phallusia mammillata TaxID=59560 RepID=A0A6F9DY30_9ASCI|nr:protein KIBRA [Phallusia mammillata]
MSETCRELPLPAGWEEAYDFDNRVFYIDHNTQRTSWIDPRDRLTKPHTFADCISTELPIGWEEYTDDEFGIYYIDHLNQVNQREDPRVVWRTTQQNMLEDYLCLAVNEIQVKEKVVTIKNEEIEEATKQIRELKHQVIRKQSQSAKSTQSLNSAGTSCSNWSICTKFDPDQVRNDLNEMKRRVAMLRRELTDAEADLTNARSQKDRWKNHLDSFQADELGEEEEKELLVSQLQSMNDRIAQLTKELRSLEEMGSCDGNPKTLLLISEKEELLNVLYTRTAGTRSTEVERKTAVDRCKQLEKELRNAKDFNNRELGERLKRVERHESVNKQLRDSMELATRIECRLRSLSASSMSLSSTSSQGSAKAMTTMSLANGRSSSCEVGIASSHQRADGQQKRAQSFTRRNNSMTRLQAQVVRRSMRKHAEQAEKGPIRPTMTKGGVSPSSSGASDSAFSSPALSSAGEGSTPLHSPPYDDVLPNRPLHAFVRRTAQNSTTTATTTTSLPGSSLSLSSSGSRQSSLTSSKSSLMSRGSSVNSLSVIDESTPTPMQLATARHLSTSDFAAQSVYCDASSPSPSSLLVRTPSGQSTAHSTLTNSSGSTLRSNAMSNGGPKVTTNRPTPKPRVKRNEERRENHDEEEIIMM